MLLLLLDFTLTEDCSAINPGMFYGVWLHSRAIILELLNQSRTQQSFKLWINWAGNKEVYLPLALGDFWGPLTAISFKWWENVSPLYFDKGDTYPIDLHSLIQHFKLPNHNNRNNFQHLKAYPGEMAERLGRRAFNQKAVGLIPAMPNDLVSLVKALHPTCLGENVPVLTISCSG